MKQLELRRLSSQYVTGPTYTTGYITGGWWIRGSRQGNLSNNGGEYVINNNDESDNDCTEEIGTDDFSDLGEHTCYEDH